MRAAAQNRLVLTDNKIFKKIETFAVLYLTFWASVAL